MEPIWSFLITALALVGSPGPNTLSAAAVGATFGLRRGLAYMIGLDIGVACVLLIAATGISGAIFALPGIAPVITIAALIYFLYLAWRIASAPPLENLPEMAQSKAPKWYAGVFLSLANPKAYAAMGALMSGHALVEKSTLTDALFKSGLAISVVILVNAVWLISGAGLAGVMRSPRASRIINLVFAGLLLISVVLVMLQ